MDALSTVYDPEVPVDIVNFGLIYGLEITDDNEVKVTMSLTSPTCPAAQSIPEECERKVGAVDGVKDVEISIVWDPPWGPEMISPEGREKLGMD
jgi:FeS assembly SUF system protein